MSVGWVSAGVGVLGILSSQSAANKQSAAADRANQITQEAADAARAGQQPYLETGAAANSALSQRLGLSGDKTATDYGSLLKQFDQGDLNKDAVYQSGLQFGLDTGTNQINQRASATGGYGSGAALKALTKFGNDYATTKAEGAYNRFTGNKNQIYSFLGGQSQQGQNAAAGTGAQGIGVANQTGSNVMAGANAQAAGTVGATNALTGYASDASNAYQWNQLLNQNKYSGVPMQPGGGY